MPAIVQLVPRIVVTHNVWLIYHRGRNGSCRSAHATIRVLGHGAVAALGYR